MCISSAPEEKKRSHSHSSRDGSKPTKGRERVHRESVARQSVKTCGTAAQAPLDQQLTIFRFAANMRSRNSLPTLSRLTTAISSLQRCYMLGRAPTLFDVWGLLPSVEYDWNKSSKQSGGGYQCGLQFRSVCPLACGVKMTFFVFVQSFVRADLFAANSATDHQSVDSATDRQTRKQKGCTKACVHHYTVHLSFLIFVSRQVYLPTL